MNIDFFVTFLSVVQTQSFTKAAHITNLSQSTVSNRISELEKHFNSTLFTRQSGRVEATQSGIDLIPFAEEIVKSYGHAKATLDREHTKDQSLRIGSVHAYYDSFLNNFLDHYMKTDHHYKIALSLKHSNEVIQGVVAGKYDIGFSHHPSKYTKFISKLIFQDELVFVGTSHVPEFTDGIHYSSLGDLTVFHSNLFDNYIDDILLKNNTYDFSIDISSRIISLLKTHEAYAFMPKKYVEGFVDRGDLFIYPVIDYTLPALEYYIIYAKDIETNNQSLKLFIDKILETTL